MDEDTIVPAKRLKTVLEAFRDTNAGKPLQVRRGLFLVIVYICSTKLTMGTGYDKIDKIVLVS